MAARLDHITVVAPNLEAGAAYVQTALGMRPGPGRAHPGMGTHNLLLALGPNVYLEVIAVDPEAAPVGRPRWFGLDHAHPGSEIRLAAWVASTDDIEGSAVPALGEIETMHREHHSWKMTVTADGRPPLDGAAPLLIQRAPGADPVAAMPPSPLLLQALRIRHPAPTVVIDLLRKIGLDSRPPIAVTEGRDGRLVAEVLTPWGSRVLGES